MIPDYDKVSWFYDDLARFVFADKLEQAKKTHLDKLKPGDKILVVGGGSGSLLRFINELGINCHIDFVDASKKMLAKARKIRTKHLTVNFFHGDILKHSHDGYDVIFTNFFFDQFNQPAAEIYLRHLITLAKPGAALVYADFVPSGRLSDRVLQYFMYNFFRGLIKLGKVQLFDHGKLFRQHGLVGHRKVSITSFIVAQYYEIVQQELS